MYRQPEVTDECAACGRAALTAPTLLDPSEGYLQVHFERRPDESRGWFADQRERVPIRLARVCLACGHVMMFVDPKRLARLQQELPSLAPIVAVD